MRFITVCPYSVTEMTLSTAAPKSQRFE